MKVLLYIPTLNGGGAERVFANLAKYFSESGINVCLITHHADTTQYINEIESIAECIVIQKNNTFALTRMIRSLVTVIKHIRKNSPNIVLTTLTEANVIGWIACVLTGSTSRHIVRQSNIIPSTSESLTPRRSIKDRSFDSLLKIALRNSTAIIANSKDTALSITRHAGPILPSIYTIYNPVINSGHQIKSTQIEHAFKFNPNKKYILNVGSLRHQKDQRNLITAFSKLRQANNNFHLLILGEGSLKRSLIDLTKELSIQDSVHFLGHSTSTHYFYSNSDIFVLSSRTEGFGNVIVEALSYGLPVVSTDCPGGPREILDYGRYGTLVPVGDSVALAKGILNELATNSNSKANERIRRSLDFSAESVGEQYISVFNNTINKNLNKSPKMHFAPESNGNSSSHAKISRTEIRRKHHNKKPPTNPTHSESLLDH